MGRKAKYSPELKAKICEAFLSGKKSAIELAKIYDLGKRGDGQIYYWSKKYKAYGINAFLPKTKNSSYSKEFKIKIVNEYLNNLGSYDDLTVKYNLPSSSTLLIWVKMYNNHIELKDYIPQSEVYMADTLKTTFEERVEIVKYCLEHDKDIKGTAAHFKAQYAQVYQWMKKYAKNGEEGLIDKRGRRKTEPELTDLEKAQRKIALLERQNEDQKKEIELLKKLNALERTF